MKVSLAAGLLALILFCQAHTLSAGVSSQIRKLADDYEKGNLESCAEILKTAKGDNAEEKAVILYYKAMLTRDAAGAASLLKQLAEAYPRDLHAQKAFYELGSISLLERDYQAALGFFNRITDPGFDDKHYWIAHTHFQKGDYTNAIASANQYIRLAKSNPLLEDAYYLTANSYIELHQYGSAITTLKQLLAKPELIKDEQYLRYRYGYAAEQLDFRAEAISQYKKGYELNRYSQLAYLIEDRLFEMRSRYGSVIDLSFLYPHVSSPLPEIVLAAQNTGNGNGNSASPDSLVGVKTGAPKEIDLSQQQGLYLQAGRFSNKKNAINLCEKIIKLNLTAQYYESKQFAEVSWVVVVGPYQAQQDAVNAKIILQESQIESFIIQR